VRKIVFHKEAFESLIEWSDREPKMVRRIFEIIKSIDTDPFRGIGKPEPLKHDLKGFWSRRITDKDRLVYKVTDDSITIIACMYHYDNKK
jgi:toxin YoeB